MFRHTHMHTHQFGNPGQNTPKPLKNEKKKKIKFNPANFGEKCLSFRTIVEKSLGSYKAPGSTSTPSGWPSPGYAVENRVCRYSAPGCVVVLLFPLTP